MLLSCLCAYAITSFLSWKMVYVHSDSTLCHLFNIECVLAANLEVFSGVLNLHRSTSRIFLGFNMFLIFEIYLFFYFSLFKIIFLFWFSNISCFIFHPKQTEVHVNIGRGMFSILKIYLISVLAIFLDIVENTIFTS